MQKIAYKKYITVFLITFGIFIVAFLLSDFIFQKRVRHIESLEDTISLNLLSSEVQFALLSEFPCKATSTPFLAQELSSLSRQLSFMESERGIDNPEVIALKKKYSLLEIKDYLFGKELAQKCGTKQSFILYFYSNKGDCHECQKTGLILTDLYRDYPDLKIYSFDYNLDVSGIRSLIEIYDIKNTLPAIVIGKKVLYGLPEKSELLKQIGLTPKENTREE